MFQFEALFFFGIDFKEIFMEMSSWVKDAKMVSVNLAIIAFLSTVHFYEITFCSQTLEHSIVTHLSPA